MVGQGGQKPGQFLFSLPMPPGLQEPSMQDQGFGKRGLWVQCHRRTVPEGKQLGLTGCQGGVALVPGTRQGLGGIIGRAVQSPALLEQFQEGLAHGFAPRKSPSSWSMKASSAGKYRMPSEVPARMPRKKA